MMWRFIFTAALFLIFMACCEAKGRVAVTVKNYQNPEHKKYFKWLKWFKWRYTKCCDLGCNACDPYFVLCVTDSRSNSDCNMGTTTTPVFKDNDNLRNIDVRREFPFVSFPSFIKINMKVWDKDTITKDDFIDKLDSGTLSITQKRRLTLRGEHVSRLTVDLDVEVSCDPYYHGASCSVWCKPRDDSSGHYACNDQGQKVCGQEWYGSSCNRRCVPRDDPVNGHFHCDKKGNRRCLRRWQSPDCKSCEKNWFGPKCATYCVPRKSDSYGHYTCRSTDGKKQCLSHWFGPGCRVHCVPSDDDSGHYVCAHDGRPRCLTGWHGRNCTRFCVPASDNKQGYYTCNPYGKKVCLDGYRPPKCKTCRLGRYGVNCSLSCVPEDSDTLPKGHFQCTKNGVRECQRWWHGPQCTQYCVPHDDDEHGHYTCDERDGSKVCREGWGGKSCLQTAEH